MLKTNEILKKKIRSQAGASIFMAMLLFMICGIIGAVVLAAATAASGRMSRLADDDQRYYSVSSAAELVTQQICDNPVEIIRERKQVTTKTTEYQYTSTGAAVRLSDSESTVTQYTTTVGSTTITDKNSKINTAAMSLLSGEAARLIFGDKKCNTDDALNYTFTAGTAGPSKPFKLSHSSSAVAEDALKALNVEGTFAGQADGSLVVTLWNASGDESFRLTVKLRPGFSDTVFPYSTTVPTVEQTANGYIEKTVTTTITQKRTTVSWTVDSIN